MKNLFTFIFFISVSMIYSQSSFSDGYKAGFKKGYCLENIGCVAPIPPVAPIPAAGFTTYSDGYARGVQDGQRKRQSNASSSSYSSPQYQSNSSGAYQNPQVTTGANPATAFSDAFNSALNNSKEGFVSARMKEWQNMRKRRLQKYRVEPTKQTVTKLYRANKVIGLPVNADILDIHMKAYLPNIKFKSQVPVRNNSQEDVVKKLKDLKELYDSKILTKEEYEKESKRLKAILLNN